MAVWRTFLTQGSFTPNAVRCVAAFAGLIKYIGIRWECSYWTRCVAMRHLAVCLLCKGKSDLNVELGKRGAFVVVGASSACGGCLYCLVFLRSALGSCLLPNVTHQFFYSHCTFIYKKNTHPTSLDAPSSPASVATRYLKSSVAFLHALYYFARLRPLQLLTGRRRRRYPNSTFKSDFLLHNNVASFLSHTARHRNAPHPVWTNL